MVDNTIALRVQTPQLESPINRMARGLQLQAYKAQADTAQQDLATRNSLRDIMSAPGFDITDPKNAQALMAADPDRGAKMVSGMTAVQDLATKKAEAGRKTLATGLLALTADQSDDTIRKVATSLAAAGAPQDALDSTVAAIMARPLSERATVVRQYIAQDAAARDALMFTSPKLEKRSTGGVDFLEDSNPNSLSFGKRFSPVQLQASPDAVLAWNTAAAKRQLDLDTERARMLAEGVLPEAVGLGGMPAPSASVGAPMGAPAAPVNALAAPGGAGAAAPMAAPAGAAAPTAAPAAPAVGPTGAPLARSKPEAKRLGELTEKLPKAEVALKNAKDSVDEQIALVESIAKDASLSKVTGSGYAPYASTAQSFLPDALAEPIYGEANLADLQAQIDQLSSEGMFIRMQELKAASPTGSTGLAAQSDAEGRALRESFAQLDQKQSPAKYKQELDRLLAKLKRTRKSLDDSFAAEFAPIRGGAAPQDGIINFEDLQ